ncbi:hypothetical protein EXIGLDRAFT_736155 [Exidia glandulosa HHB12029]|uniref:Uncharacterized protein n=1 Tax=Exidia glandulosa HHB12029 TaxID=1314781 RepID=A0A165JJ00_EXIGL|nr:hypothetical protein EXIGLDRAFT_736155 [Exidia glandulosa HHB12029]
MSIKERPLTSDQPVPQGTFVVIRLDPVASVAALHDEQATREARTMRPAKYLALVDMIADFSYDARIGGHPLNLQFFLAGHGLPAAPLSVDALVSRIYLHDTPGPCFAPETFRELNSMAWDDQGRSDNSSDAKEAKLDFHEPWHDADNDRGDAEVSSTTPVLYNATDWRDLLPGYLKKDEQEMELHAELWVDIVEHKDDFGTPADIAREISELKRIEWDWARRVVAARMNRPQTSEWLDDVAAEDVDPDVNREEVVEDYLDDDGSVGPEDAIEHRIEREEALAEEAFDGEDGHAHEDDVASVARSSCRSPVSIASSYASRVHRGTIPSTSVFVWIITRFRLSGVLERFRSLFRDWIWAHLQF